MSTDYQSMPERSDENQFSSGEYNQLISSFAEAVWQTDAQGQVVEDAPGWRAYTDQTLQQWLSNGWLEAVHPDDHTYAYQQWQQAIETHTSLNAELRLRSADGGWRWTTVRATAIRNPDGAITKWVGISTNVTERKEQQTYLLKLNDALRPLPDPVDTQGRAAQLLGEYLDTDRAYYVEIHEATHEFAVARDWHQPGSPSHARRYPLGDWPMPWLINGKTWVVRDTTTDPAMPDDQRKSYLGNDIGAAVVVPLIKQGRLVATLVVNQRSPRSWTPIEVSVVEETAERTWAAVERARAEEALLEVNQRKDEFLALLAHELRNPMATLSNTLLILELTSGQDESMPLEPALLMMRREVAQLVRLVDDLLDVSRINQGKIVLRLERLELTDILEEAIEATRPLIESTHRHLEINLPAEPLYLRGDAVRLTQVVRNLLSNAIKFTREGGHIWLSLERQGNEAILQVRDDGIGIPADQLERIFGLFAQVDASRTRPQGGLGLGLTLVSEFIVRHGGRVEARSAGLDRGSEFTIYLPISNFKPNESIR